MTVRENMGFSLRLRSEKQALIDQRVAQAAKILNLEPFLQRYPRELSGGQRQRVAMGRAIVRDPKVFLFDEPLSNLDAKLRVAMRTEIKALHQRLTTTAIYVTHDQIEAMTMADKIVVMNNGKVEQIGSPLELYDNPVNLFVAGFIGSPAMNFVKGKVNGGGIAVGNGIDLPNPTRNLDAGREVLIGVRPEHLAVDDSGVPVEVVVVEPTGADTQIFCTLAGTAVTAVVRERHTFRPGEAVRLKPQLTYLFDPSSGARLA
jgi:multiple sugar transport system ATP-binding protein